MMRAIRYIVLATIIVGSAATLILVAIIFYGHFFGPCAHAPASVPFRQGMTLCPGQTARGTLQIQPEGGGK